MYPEEVRARLVRPGVLIAASAAVVLAAAWFAARLDIRAEARVRAGGQTFLCQIRERGDEAQVIVSIEVAGGEHIELAWPEASGEVAHRGKARILSHPERDEVQLLLGGEEMVFAPKERTLYRVTTGGRELRMRLGRFIVEGRP